jgi:hypothetical protein
MPHNNIILDNTSDIEKLKIISEHIKRQKDAKVAKIINMLNGQNAPWPDAVVEQFSLMTASEAGRVLAHHPGYNLYIIWQSIANLLPIFKASYDDMLSSLDVFHIKAKDESFFSRRRHDEFENACLQINKCMYHFSSTSISLYNMCQSFRGLFNPTEYIMRYDACYTNSHEHHLVKAIRNSLSHKHFVPASYHIKAFQNSYETFFYVQTSALLEHNHLHNPDKKHVLKAGEKIEIRPVFEKNGKNIIEFYEWVRARLEEDVRFTDYHRCKMAPRRYATRSWWKIVMKQIETKKIDPYEHLTNYFTDDELAEIKKLPHRSKEQADRMIKIFDEDQACDNAMRQRIYSFLNISS